MLLPRDVTKSSKSTQFFGLPIEVRLIIYIYSGLMVSRLPNPPSALTHVNRQLREEVHDWIARQKLTLLIHDRRLSRLGPRDEPILRRATNIEFEISRLPSHPSHDVIDLLCRLWRDECYLKKVSFIVLDDSISAESYDCGSCSGVEHLIQKLPSANKQLLCKWLLHPVRMLLAKHGVQLAQTSVTWKHPLAQPSSSSRHQEIKRDECQNDRAIAIVPGAFAETTTSDLDTILMPLVSAVRQRHGAVIDVLLNSTGMDLKQRTTGGKTLLMIAADCGDTHIMDRLLRGRNPGEVEELLNLQDDEGNTAIHLAAYRRDLKMVSHLLGKNVDPDIRDLCGRTPLFRAIDSPEYIAPVPLMRLLCKNDRVNKMAKDRRGRTVLHLSVHDPDTFRVLSQHSGVGINEPDDEGQTPIFCLAQFAESSGKLDKLINSYGALVNVQDKVGQTALHHAVRRRLCENIDVLLKAGADCTLKDKWGKSPMSCAVEGDGYGDAETTQRLVKHVKNGNQALILAGQMRKESIELALLKMPTIDTGFKEENVRRLLIQAARDGREDIVLEILYSHKIEADVQDIDGRTPLSHAAETGRRAVIELLMERGADRNLKDKHDLTPVDYARNCDEQTLGQLLEDWSSRLKEQDDDTAARRRMEQSAACSSEGEGSEKSSPLLG